MKVTSESKPYPSGSIICTASTAGIRSNAGSTDYSASKAAVVSIAQTCSYQLAGTGIRINAICPGFVDTPIIGEQIKSGSMAPAFEMTPIGRPAQVEEISDALLFLDKELGVGVFNTTVM